MMPWRDMMLGSQLFHCTDLHDEALAWDGDTTTQSTQRRLVSDMSIDCDDPSSWMWRAALGVSLLVCGVLGILAFLAWNLRSAFVTSPPTSHHRRQLGFLFMECSWACVAVPW